MEESKNDKEEGNLSFLDLLDKNISKPLLEKHDENYKNLFSLLERFLVKSFKKENYSREGKILFSENLNKSDLDVLKNIGLLKKIKDEHHIDIENDIMDYFLDNENEEMRKELKEEKEFLDEAIERGDISDDDKQEYYYPDDTCNYEFPSSDDEENYRKDEEDKEEILESAAMADNQNPQDNVFKVQLKSERSGLSFVNSFELALSMTREDLSIWKMSFSMIEDGKSVRYRLIRDDHNPDKWRNHPLGPKDKNIEPGEYEPLPSDLVKILNDAGFLDVS